MNDNDILILHTTAIGPSTLMCPLPFCAFMLELPDVPVSDDVAAVFGLSGQTLARMHAEHICTDKAGTMREHLAGHTVEDWLKFTLLLRAANSPDTPPLATVTGPLPDDGRNQPQ